MSEGGDACTQCRTRGLKNQLILQPFYFLRALLEELLVRVLITDYMRCVNVHVNHNIEKGLQGELHAPGVFARARYRATTSRLWRIAASWACFIVPICSQLAPPLCTCEPEHTRNVDDVRDVSAPVDRRHERDAGPRDLVRVARDADDAHVRPRGEIFDYRGRAS